MPYFCPIYENINISNVKMGPHRMFASDVIPLSLLSNSGMGFGFNVILNFEAVQKGVHWNNLWDNMPPLDDVALGPIMLMLLLDAILYFLLALCVINVPRAKCWNLPVSRVCYWWKKSGNSGTDNVPNKNSGENFEIFTGNLPAGIRLINLSKSFKKSTVVKELNLDMYEGHITVLLGHNGAGKTITTSIITGLCSPSSGTAIVNGYDVRRNLRDARSSLGMCLQEDTLFDELTVWEHLYFFSKLKGLNDEEAQQEIDNYLKMSELEEKKGAKSKTLSGGMKRKLCIGIALCGKPKIVILDEPTSGMDTSARRMFWDLLQKLKQGRTILLTTHFMDEADILGDRIAIMSGGQLQCCGSSFFLKRKYGSGYHLIIDVAPECNLDKVTSLLRSHIPTVQVHSHAGSELRYRLSEKESSKFESMFSNLELNMTSLSIRSYGLSVAPLGEVFMKVGVQHKNMNQQLEDKNHTQNIDNSSAENLKGFSLIINQCIATYLKKSWSSLRMWYLFLLALCLQIVLLMAGIKNRSMIINPPLKISLDQYGKPTTLISGDINAYSLMYEKTLTGFKITRVEDIAATILEMTKASLGNVRRNYIVAASFHQSVATAWYNGDWWHALPLAMSLVLNAVYKKQFGPQYSINFVNYPLPRSLKEQTKEGRHLSSSLFVPLQLELGLTLFSCLFIIFVIRERVCKAKHLQFVSGLNPFVFWLTAFLCDLIIFLLFLCAVLFTLAALQIESFQLTNGLDRVAVLLIVFAVCSLAFIYLASFLFSHSSTGYFVLLGVAIFVELVLVEITKNNGTHWIFIPNPFFSLGRGFNDFNEGDRLREICSHSGSFELACQRDSSCCDVPGYLSMRTPGAGAVLVGAILGCICSFLILFCIDYGCPCNTASETTRYTLPDAHLESDVQQEYRMIRNTDEIVLNSTCVLVLRDLTKYYSDLLAVNCLCLGLKPFECFGLVGPNGAGKTTTFKMMIGEIESSYGDVWVHGLNTKTKYREICKLIGYCPQFDALLSDLTVKETLQIFCLIRGVPLKVCNSVKQKLAKELDFSEHMNEQQIKTLSGGNKRKISLAIAVIGDPPIIYLDEPTTGMDPGSKRAAWSVLTNLRSKGACIILSSHSMEECEALCTRLVIMAQGSFRCLGSVQRLRSKFAQGYTLTIKMKKNATENRLNDQINAVDKFIQKNFREAQLAEKYQEKLVYELDKLSMPLSQMFGILEKNKNGLNIEDYSLEQYNLEKVFLNLTKDQ